MPTVQVKPGAETVVDLPFPIGGIDQSQPRAKQGSLTCTNALNTVPFPPIADRLCGGKRHGTRRTFTNAVAAAAAQPLTILGLNHVPGLTSSAAALTDLSYVYPTADQASFPSPAGSWWRVGGTTNLYTEVDDPHGTPDDTDYDSTQPYSHGTPNPVTGLTETTMRWNCGAGAASPVSGTGVHMFVRFRMRAGVSPGGHHVAEPSIPAASTGVSVSGTALSGSIQGGSGGPLFADQGYSYSTQPEPYAQDMLCAANVRFTLYYDSTGAGDWVPLDYVDTPFTSIVGDWVSQEFLFEDIAAIPAACYTNAARLAISCTSGENGHCGGFFLDVSYAHLGWQASGTPPPPPGPATGNLLILLADKVYVGNIKTDALGTPTTPTGLTRQFPSIGWYAGYWYVVDGNDEKRITPANPPVVTDYKTDSDTAYPAGNTYPAGCRVVCHWRNRIVMANQEGAANGETLGFMSAVGDPLDYRIANDSDKPAEISALAFANKFVNTPADAITCLIPWSDDLLIVGGANTINRFEGDPGQNGTFANLTQQTGILGDRAWCFDEFGNLWFMGSSGLYRMTRDGQIKNISGRKLYRELDRLDGNNNLIQLSYDAFAKTVNIFFTPYFAGGGQSLSAANASNVGGSLHVLFDITTESFWFVQYPQRFGPWSVCRISGATDDDRRYLMGGNQGHIYRPFDGGKLNSSGLFSPTGTSRPGTADDLKRDGTSISGSTTAIETSVRYPPIEGLFGDYELMFTEITGTGEDNNLPLNLPLGPVQGLWLAADSAAVVSELAAVPNAQASWSWFGPGNYGLQKPLGMRISAGAHQLVLRQHSATQSWSVGRITAKFRRGGRRR